MELARVLPDLPGAGQETEPGREGRRSAGTGAGAVTDLIDGVLAVVLILLLVVAAVTLLILDTVNPGFWVTHFGRRCDHVFTPPDYVTCEYCHRTIPLPPEE